MKRREFIPVLGGTVTAWPLAARAQQGERVRRIGVQLSGAQSDPEMQARVGALRDGLKALGWIEGRNIQIEYRRTGSSPERARTYAAELVAMDPEVIFAAPTFVVAALQRETRTVPVVFAKLLKSYGVTRIQGDHYGGEFCREPFRKHGIEYEVHKSPKSARRCGIGRPDTTGYARHAASLRPTCRQIFHPGGDRRLSGVLQGLAVVSRSWRSCHDHDRRA